MSNLEILTEQIRQLRKSLDRRVAEARILAANSKTLKDEIELAAHDVELYNKVALTLASIGEQRQADAQKQIEELVSRGLSTIFGEKICFNVVQTQRGKTPEVKFTVKTEPLNGRSVETSVMDARGGGMAAVIGFLLRLVILLLTPDQDPVLVLDESFSHVSAEYRRPLAEFIVELVSKTQAQIFLVTHDEIFLEYADKRYRVSQNREGSQVVEF